jgi:hypothetical protein
MNNIIGIERTPFIPTMPYMPGGQTPVYVGTITGLRISSVNGTAFVDGLNAAVLALPLDATHSIEIYDSSNRFLRGVLKSVGVAETYSTEKISNGNFTNWGGVSPNELPTSWEATGTRNATNYTSNSTSRCLLVSDGTYIGIKQVALVDQTLYYATIDIKAVTAGSIVIGQNAVSATQITYNTTGVKEHRFTASGVASFEIKRGGSVAANVTVDDSVLKQVLTPSSSGAVIQASKTDSTENFGYSDASFTYNATSYVVRVYTIR